MFVCLKRFKRDEDGAAAVELALWMPFFWLIFGMIVDATMLFQYQTRFLDVAREASRQVSIDRMTQMEAYSYIVGKFPDIDNLDANILVDGTSVTATIDAPLSSLTIFSDLFTGQHRVNGKISMFMEEAISASVPTPTGGV